MDEFITIADFTWPTDAVVPRGLLDEAGIETQLKDEFTVQVYNLYSQAVGGVKLQVHATDADRARAILREGGFLNEGPAHDPTLWLELDRVTRAIPLIGRINLLVARLFVIIAIVLGIILIPIAISAQPSMVDLLTSHDWCVDRVQLNGADITAASTDVLVWLNACPEKLRFDNSGRVALPGFDSPSQYVTWRIDGSALHFENMVGHQDVYAAPFAVAVNEDYLTLRSASTTIHCTRNSLPW